MEIGNHSPKLLVTSFIAVPVSPVTVSAPTHMAYTKGDR